jgi:hypothetical protein
MVPVGMAPMELMPGMAQEPFMSDMYNSMCPTPGMYNPCNPMLDEWGGSHLGGNPNGAGAGAFIGFPFFSPFFFRRRFFPFFPFFFFPFF